MACGAFSPDFLIRMKTMIASSTTAEIESATAAHLQGSQGRGGSDRLGVGKSVQQPAGSYPRSASDHNYPYARIDRRTAAQGGAWPIWSGHDDRASLLPAPARAHPALHARRAARVHRGARRFPRRVPAVLAPVRTGRTSCGSSTWRTARSASPPIRGRCSGAPRNGCRPRSGRAASAAARAVPGIVGYATDTAVELASFALSGRLFTAELRAGTARELRVPGPVIDPRPSPDGRLVAYVSGGALRVVGAEGEDDRALAEPESATTVSYGSRRVHRGRGDGAFARLLVVAGVGPAAGRAGRRRARTPLVDLRSGASGTRSAAGRVSGGGHAPTRRCGSS